MNEPPIDHLATFPEELLYPGAEHRWFALDPDWTVSVIEGASYEDEDGNEKWRGTALYFAKNTKEGEPEE